TWPHADRYFIRFGNLRCHAHHKSNWHGTQLGGVDGGGGHTYRAGRGGGGDQEIDFVIDHFQQGRLIVQYADLWAGQYFDLAEGFQQGNRGSNIAERRSRIEIAQGKYGRT